MKVLHLATKDIGGGGFDAAYRLHCNMQAHHIDSRMLVLHKSSDDPSVIDVSAHLMIADKLRRFRCKVENRCLRQRLRLSPYFYVDPPEIIPAHRMISILPFQPDVIIAHWISNFINAAVLRNLNHITHAPILWHVVDMAPFTGGCHYAFGCTGYTRQCKKCSQIKVRKIGQNLAHLQWQSKWSCLRETNITAVAASSWSQTQVQSSSIFRNKRCETILLGADSDTFCPIPQAKAREQLNLPINRKIIFFGATHLQEERKGLHHFLESLRFLHILLDDKGLLPHDRVLIVTAGSSATTVKMDIPFEHRYLGFLNGDAMLSAAYQSADVFVNASTEDAGPMMINESLLCGTPVVSFDMGVAKDLVHTGKTGYRARLAEDQDMAIGLRGILELNDEQYHAMRERCRNLGLQKCNADVQVRALGELCSELISDARN